MATNYYCIKGELEPGMGTEMGTFIGSISYDVDNFEVGPCKVVVNLGNGTTRTFDNSDAGLINPRIISFQIGEDYHIDFDSPDLEIGMVEEDMVQGINSYKRINVTYKDYTTGEERMGDGAMMYDPSQGSKDCSASFDF